MEKKYEEILNKKNINVYSIKISSDIMRIKNINEKQGVNYIEIKKIDVNSMIANDITILKLDNFKESINKAEDGTIKNKKFYLKKVKIFDINKNIYEEKIN